MALKTIDFTNGIRSESIDYNFKELESAIERERLAVAGHGISSGLNITVSGFALNITEGKIIDTTGEEIIIPSQVINIALPRLTTSTENKFVTEAGQITVSELPYSITARKAAEFDLRENFGISIVDKNNISKTVPVTTVNDNVIFTTSNWANKEVSITYRHTNKRWDIVYIDTNNKIKVMEGFTSNSPTLPDMSKVSHKYILGKVLVNPFYVKNFNGVLETVAILEFQRNGDSLRTIYTDSNNNLFIGGKSFDDLQVINMFEPTSPNENELWYDSISNKLRVWKTVDGIASWVNVNDTSIIPVKEYKVWSPLENPIDRQFFFFNNPLDMNLRFIPKKNELEVFIDNGALHSDQFEEITILDVKNDNALKNLAIQAGYSSDMINTMSEEYENVGIGFKLEHPLENKCYVEVRTTHRVNDNPIRTRFQRTATFIDENSFLHNVDNGNVVSTRAPYRIGEGQLEVFVDGARLSTGIDYTEGVDLDVANRIKGAASTQFLLVKNVLNNSRITYKIVTSIYSYDHVENAMSGLGERMVQSEEKVDVAVAQVDQLHTDTTAAINSMQTQVNTVVAENADHAIFVKNTDVLGVNNMPVEVMNQIPKGIIDQSLVKNGAILPVSGFSPEDFVVMFDIQSMTGNSILRRGVDYQVQKADGSENTVIAFLNPAAVPDGHSLYIIGIKFKA